MNVVAVIQARMGSKRFPGKSMAELNGRPLVQWCIERALAAKGVGRVALAIPEGPADDILDYAFRLHRKLTVVRGSETNVQARFLLAASVTRASVLVRITADQPFIRSETIGRVVAEVKAGSDYAGALEVPPGFIVEAFTVAHLRDVSEGGATHMEQEHVALRMRPTHVEAMAYPEGMNLSIDRIDDLFRCRRCLKHFDREDFTEQEAIDAWENYK